MSLVNPGTLRLRWTWVLRNIALSFWRIPEDAVVYRRDGNVLLDPRYPGRYPFYPFARGRNDHGDLDLALVGYGRLSIGCRQRYRPPSVIFLLHGSRVSIPAIEIADKVGPQRVWGPLSVGDVSIVADDEAESFESSAEFVEASLGLIDFLDPFLSMAVSASERFFERGEPRVQLNDT